MSPSSHPSDAPGRSRVARFFLNWISITLSVFAAAHIVPGIRYDDWRHLALAALFLGFLNAFVRPLLMVLSLPFLLLTLGLGIFIVLAVINALFIWLAGAWVPGFDVQGFWPAIGGGLVVGICGSILNRLFGIHSSSTQKRPSRPQPGHSHSHGPPEGKGPIIDV